MKFVESIMKDIVKARRSSAYTQKEVSFRMQMNFKEYQLFEGLKFPVSRSGLESILEIIDCKLPDRYIDELMKYYEKMKEQNASKIVETNSKTTYINPKFIISILIDKREQRFDPDLVTSIKLNYTRNTATINYKGQRPIVVEQCSHEALEMFEQWAKSCRIRLID